MTKKILFAAMGLLIFVGAGCTSSSVSVQPAAEAPATLPVEAPPAAAGAPVKSDEQPVREVLTFQDELQYAASLGTDNCVMPADSDMTAAPQPTEAEFYPDKPDLKFTMRVPYSDAWSFLGKRLPPAQLMYDEVNYYFGKASMKKEIGQDIYCGFRREYQVHAEKGGLAGLSVLSKLTVGEYPAAMVAVETDDPSATEKPVELVVQVGDLLVYLFPANDETKGFAETIRR